MTFKCIVCTKKFENKSKLRQHLLKKHLFSQNYNCKHCAKKFSQKARLDLHLKRFCKVAKNLNRENNDELKGDNFLQISTPKSMQNIETHSNFNEIENAVPDANKNKNLFNPMDFIKCNYKKK